LSRLLTSYSAFVLRLFLSRDRGAAGPVLVKVCYPDPEALKKALKGPERETAITVF
jgi:hypothetical protein